MRNHLDFEPAHPANLNFGGVRFREQPRPVQLREYRRRRQAIGEGTWASLNRTEVGRVATRVLVGQWLFAAALVLALVAILWFGAPA